MHTTSKRLAIRASACIVCSVLVACVQDGPLAFSVPAADTPSGITTTVPTPMDRTLGAIHRVIEEQQGAILADTGPSPIFVSYLMYQDNSNAPTYRNVLLVADGSNAATIHVTSFGAHGRRLRGPSDVLFHRRIKELLEE